MSDWTVVKRKTEHRKVPQKIIRNIDILEVAKEASHISPIIVQDQSIVHRIGEFIKEFDRPNLRKDDSYRPILDTHRLHHFLNHPGSSSRGLEIVRKETIKPAFYHSTLDILHTALGDRYDDYLSKADFVTSRGVLLQLMRLFESHPDSRHLTSFELQISRKKIHPNSGSQTVWHLGHGDNNNMTGSGPPGASFTLGFREAMTCRQARYDPGKTLGRVGRLHLPLTGTNGNDTGITVLVTYEVDALLPTTSEEVLLRTFTGSSNGTDHWYSLAVSDTDKLVLGAYRHAADGNGTGSKAEVTGIEVVSLGNVLPVIHEARRWRMAQLGVLLLRIRQALEGCHQATLRYTLTAPRRHSLVLTLFPK